MCGTKENGNLETEDENISTPGKRHGCVTAWLYMIIITSSIVFGLFLALNEIFRMFFSVDSKPLMLWVGISTVCNLTCAILILQWKKIGFWGYAFLSLAAVIVNIFYEASIGQTLYGLLGVAILYGLLQIKKDNVSTWERLE